MEKKRILITGASGFVGSFLVEEAIQRGYSVYAGIRKSSSRAFLQHKDIKFVTIDFNDFNALQTLFDNQYFHYIIQNAGITKARNEAEYYDVNAFALQKLVKALYANERLPEKFIFMSSMAAYGPADFTQNGLVSINSTPHPVTTYGKSKLLGENLLKEFDTLPYHILRPTAVYGPREKDLLTLYKTIQRGWEVYIGSQPQQLTFVYVKDLVDATMNLLNLEKSGTSYFISDGNYYYSHEFYQMIAEILKRKTCKIHIPVVVIKGLAYLNQILSAMRGNYPAFNLEKVNELKSLSWKCDIIPLINDIGYQPQYPLKKGLQETLEWLQSQNEL
ncbi:MAG TPA: NAD(P)-dependent oxidoreductase [Saprospiraceae bacterium]|nr:NAD(P)-dependent oxidoreductase [Saprospiraceae bacterium]